MRTSSRWLVDLSLPYCHCVYMTVKDDRLQVRVDPESKRLLEKAAQASHLNLSAFVLQAARERAEELLADRATLTLSPEAAAAFEAALQAPAQANTRLAEALRRTAKFTWLD